VVRKFPEVVVGHGKARDNPGAHAKLSEKPTAPAPPPSMPKAPETGVARQGSARNASAGNISSVFLFMKLLPKYDE
jgi:hypothetical protein